MRSRRFEKRAERPVNKDTFVQESVDLGLVVMNSPYDPKPSIRLERGRIVEIDGRSEESFDLIDRYIARYAINAATAEKTMATDSLKLARMIIFPIRISNSIRSSQPSTSNGGKSRCAESTASSLQRAA